MTSFHLPNPDIFAIHIELDAPLVADRSHWIWFVRNDSVAEVIERKNPPFPYWKGMFPKICVADLWPPIVSVLHEGNATGSAAFYRRFVMRRPYSVDIFHAKRLGQNLSTQA